VRTNSPAKGGREFRRFLSLLYEMIGLSGKDRSGCSRSHFLMSNVTESPATTPIPVQLSEPEFVAFIFPHPSMPRRGPKCKLGYHRVFNLILWVTLHGYAMEMCAGAPGRRWDVIHSMTIYKVFGPTMARSIRYSSPRKAFGGATPPRSPRPSWRLLQHRREDKVEMTSAIPATNIRRARKSSR
jgi:hypothetical protein